MATGMLRDFHRIGWCDRAPAAALLSVALFVAGCSSGSFGGPSTPAAPPAIPASTSTTDAAPLPPPPSSSPSLKDKIANFFSGSSAKSQQTATNADASQPAVDCPFIDIREGASTLTIPPPNGENNAMALKYQGTFVRGARECLVVNGQMTMKVGVQGRIIVGPAGGPGQVEVPLRIAIVDAPPVNPKTIVTKLIRIPVTVASADQNTTFTHIEEGLTFPLPKDGSLENYIVYIGFDPIGAEAQAKEKPAPKAKPKPKVNPNAPTG